MLVLFPLFPNNTLDVGLLFLPFEVIFFQILAHKVLESIVLYCGIIVEGLSVRSSSIDEQFLRSILHKFLFLPKNKFLVITGEFSEELLPISFLFFEGILETLDSQRVKSLEKISNADEIKFRSGRFNRDVINALDLG